ncbi:MAG: TetR/AcrR family transcriptional regulator [Pseudomonadota bacterium]
MSKTPSPRSKASASAMATPNSDDAATWSTGSWPLSFVQLLDMQTLLNNGRKKDRTKARLLAATARQLENHGYGALTHADICKAADISVGTFYKYFENRSEICLYVLKRFLEFISTARNSALESVATAMRADPDPYGSILVANYQALLLMRHNRGLFRCLVQSQWDTDELTMLWRSFSAEWYQRAAHRAWNYIQDADFNEIHFRTILMGGFIDEFIRAYLIDAEPVLNKLVGGMFKNDVETAAAVSDIWYRVVLDQPLSKHAQAVRVELLRSLPQIQMT